MVSSSVSAARTFVIVTSTGDGARRAALAALAPDGPARFAHAGEPIEGSEDGLIVVDGFPDATPDDVRRIDDRARRGTTVLVLCGSGAPGPWGALVGADLPATLRRAEYMLELASHPLTARLERTAGVVDRVRPLGQPGGDEIASVSVGFTDHPVVVRRSLGHGQLVLSGVGTDTDALAAPSVRRLLGRAVGRPADATTLGVAVVGFGPYGGMGQRHGVACRAVDGLDFVAAVDTSDERRKAAEREFPGIAVYPTVDELLTDDAVDVVVVATPPASHAVLAARLLDEGRHVVVEKPMCLTAAEADGLIRRARDAGRVLTVHQNRRWDPDYLALRRAVDTGLLGEVFNVETFVGGFDHPCRAWHSHVPVSGGAVYDWGSHHVDWILQLLGDRPSRVTTFGHKRVWHDVTNLDQLRLHLAWDDGREAEFFQSDVAAVRRPKFFVQGTEGTLVGHYRPVATERVDPVGGYVREEHHHAEAPADIVLARYEPGYGITETALPPGRAPEHAFHRNLADHLLLGEPLAVSPESVRDVVAILEASQRSSDAGGVEIRL
ncbi:MAG TPA: Gfo/Idh/MocA family oxidoreductase [Acidimicrobiales bacterium]|nr:Gfo/Idh/MocA family oxidoreductase [Acidimicrobiales bacterium]